MPKDYGIRRENYCKFNKVHEKLITYLEDGVSAKMTAKDLNISLPTYYKYKSIISIENNKIYKVKEEADFLDREKKRKENELLVNNKKYMKKSIAKKAPIASAQAVDETKAIKAEIKTADEEKHNE
jgi:hypothetical protein